MRSGSETWRLCQSGLSGSACLRRCEFPADEFPYQHRDEHERKNEQYGSDNIRLLLARFAISGGSLGGANVLDYAIVLDGLAF
jgi:hypothetical protein